MVLWGLPLEKQQEQLSSIDILKHCSIVLSLFIPTGFLVTATAGNRTSGEKEAIANAFYFHFQLKH